VKNGMTTDDDFREMEALLTRIADGDSGALESLHCLTADRLFGLTFAILKDPHESEDALQETFLKIWKKAGSYRANWGCPLGWLLTITRHTAYDRQRKRMRRAEHMKTMQLEMKARAEASDAQPADDQLQGVERQARIREALANLSQEQRDAIELTFFSGHTQLEVSEKLGLPLGTTKSRIRRGMQSLRPFLTPLS
jgi:RNA polymerase sigma-70 factor (ECF subfamily)